RGFVDPWLFLCYHRCSSEVIDMYMIIVGAGTIGARLIDIATKEKNNVVVIEQNVERAKEISNKYDVTVLNRDATSAESLREAGSDRTNVLITTTSDDAVNLMVVSIANRLEIPSIVSVVNEKDHAEFFRKLGANVMENPEDVVANHLYTAVKRPQVDDFAILSNGAQVFRMMVKEEGPLVGKSTSEIRKQEIIPSSVLIVAIERGGNVQIAEGETVIESEDLLTFYSVQRVTDELIEKVTG
ncbi:TrkA family potassium uptake protein, partial [Candidatus Bipolaricaulota bacterium]|nr:TrkA family potassium uptake protein [Candidatus Bipolaricaulota bacterium]